MRNFSTNYPKRTARKQTCAPAGRVIELGTNHEITQMTAVGIINVIERVDLDKGSRNMSQRHKVTSVRHFGLLFPVNRIIRYHGAAARQHYVVRLLRTNIE